jgi:hypothetical protein
MELAQFKIRRAGAAADEECAAGGNQAVRELSARDFIVHVFLLAVGRVTR